MRQIGREPIFVERGEGCELIDVDGNRYVDWVCSWGPLILGHAHPEVVAAVTEAAPAGTSYGAATEAEVELAEEVVDPRPLGGDAADDQLRHRGGDERGPPRPRGDRPRGRGQVRRRLPRPLRRPARRRRLGPGDARHPRQPRGDRRAGGRHGGRALERSRRRSAAPSPSTRSPPCSPSRSPANMGVVPAEDGFLEFLRAATRDAGALLVFDEVISGFRVARGGAQELYGVEPDLTVLGKVLGGGLPAAAFGGPRGDDGTHRPRRRRLPGGDALGQPARGRRRPGDAAPARRRGLRAPRDADRPPRRRPRRARRRPRRCRSPRLPACSPSSSAPSRSPTSPPRRPATSTPTPASAGRCSTAASTRRRRSSRPGSSRSPTTRRRSTARSKPPPSRCERGACG